MTHIRGNVLNCLDLLRRCLLNLKGAEMRIDGKGLAHSYPWAIGTINEAEMTRLLLKIEQEAARLRRAYGNPLVEKD